MSRLSFLPAKEFRYAESAVNTIKMNRRNQNGRPVRSIRGPQSALTDFLASHNISAHQIQLNHQQRVQQAQDNGQNADDPSTPASDAATSEPPRAADAEKRRKEEQKAIDKIKASKKFQKQKKRLQDSDDEDELVLEMLRATAPKAGQLANCEICGKRFTVTPYTSAGPNGSGLLCNPCAKELAKDAPPPKKKRASGGPVGRRRKVQSKILDGTYVNGAQSLLQLCINTLVKNIQLADDLGDLPRPVIDKIARVLSKRRLLDSGTLKLFMKPSAEELFVYDGAKLSSSDLISIFQIMPRLKRLRIRNAIQFKDVVVDYLLSRDNIDLESLSVHGANLVTEEAWQKYLTLKGQSLKELKVYYTDNHFRNDTMKLLKTAAPSLTRFKLYHNQKVDGEGVKELANLKELQHLSIDLHKRVHSDIYVRIIKSIGTNLKTLSLRMVPELDNTVLDALHTNCRNLEKLRITDSEVMTDEGFARLFEGWQNPGLVFLDLQKCRQLDSTHPRNNPDHIGLCSDGFRALMAHSGKTLRYLNIHASRHISPAAFEEVFSVDKVYPELRDLEISFCPEVTDFIVGSIFRSCPNLRELNVFGCMKIKDVRVPRGKILVGVPNALGMQIEGDD
ncbi:DNA repair protein rhp7 [Pleurostoma richardsiae]|uniref:DNA repair protein rhp7 n=1 Tax=Pleurostoma richardsiae TaxID=41990 RepID=A0AA38VPE3_9PEZI|nr:DNA repair protein rhp7 [Pleurostoma richardsiae]